MKLPKPHGSQIRGTHQSQTNAFIAPYGQHLTAHEHIYQNIHHTSPSRTP